MHWIHLNKKLESEVLEIECMNSNIASEHVLFIELYARFNLQLFTFQLP